MSDQGLANQRLLVLGDLQAEIEVIEPRLRQSGVSLTCLSVHTPGEFSESVESFNPDLIIFDCRLPRLDEKAALGLSRERPLDVPFIVISNGGRKEDLLECVDAGAWSCVSNETGPDLAAAVISAVERNRLLREKGSAEAALRQYAQRCWNLFETTPIPLWREDFSAVRRYVQGLRMRGVLDFRGHFDRHPDEVQHCASLIRVLDVNSASVKLFGGSQKEDLQAYLSSVFCEESWDVLKEQLIAVGEGRRLVETEATYADLRGRRMHGLLRWWVALGYEESYAEIFLSLLDTTRHKQAEKEISMLAHTVRSITECVSIADMNDRVLFVNEAFRKTYGYEEEEILGKSIEEVRSPNNPPFLIREILPETLRGGWRGELLNRRKDGSEFPIQLSTSVIRDEEGRPIATVGIASDITDRRKAEEDLFRSRSMLQLVLDNIPVRVFWKARDFRYLGCNQSFAQDAHLEKPDDILGKDDFELSWRDSAALYRADDELVIRTNQPKLNFEEPQSKPDGSMLWLRTNKVPLHDRDGQVMGVLGTYEDITESKRAEEALRASEEKYRSFFEEDLSGDYIAAPDGKLLACNATFAEIFGFDSVEEALQTDVTCLFPRPEARQEFLQALQREKKLVRHESELRRKDGRPVFVVENAFGIFDGSGCLKEIKGYIFDDTDRKKLEEQLRRSQKMEALGTLAGGIAHDFNNLLTCIMGYCDLLLGEVDARSPMRADLEEIRDSGERAVAMVRQLLAFSRRQVLQPRTLDINHLITEMEKLIRRLIGEDINLRVAPQAGIVPVKADPGQIEQVIMNLVVNSRDAMPNGGDLVIRTSSCQGRPEEGQNGPVSQEPHVMIEVCDTGCGMSQELLSHVFEPFFTTKEGGKGTGLGLSTVYGIVRQSGGSISVESEEGRGTTFRICLPRADGEAVDPGRKPSPKATHRGLETILLVEDDRAVQALSARTLRMLGYAVLEARNGDEAISIGRQHQGPIHLLVTDVIMPGISGRVLAQKVQAARPETRVLFVSGYAEKAESQLGEVAANEILLAKPFTAEGLGLAVRSVLDRKQSP